jgi:4-carboxymuconolactone decarboxylase
MPQLNAALNQGLDAGLTVSETKEILGQLYAYAGFPRSLNALGEMMKVMDARRQRGIQDAPGRDPSAPIPTGRELLALGALAAMPGVESQLQSHIQFSMNVGLTPAQLRQLGEVLGQRGQPDAARRVQAAIDRQLAKAGTNAPGRH